MVRSAEPVGAVEEEAPPSPLNLHTAGFQVPASVAPVVEGSAVVVEELKMLLVLWEVAVGEETEWARDKERSSCEAAPEPEETFAREEEEEGEKMVDEGLERVLDWNELEHIGSFEDYLLTFNLEDFTVQGTHISTLIKNSRAGGGKFGYAWC